MLPHFPFGRASRIGARGERDCRKRMSGQTGVSSAMMPWPAQEAGLRDQRADVAGALIFFVEEAVVTGFFCSV
jgi:hypothetical protein